MNGYGANFANALRAMKIVQARHSPYKTTRQDIMGWMRDEFVCSRATAYRLAAAAIDVLGLAIAEDAAAAIVTHAAPRSRPDQYETTQQHFGADRPLAGFKTVEV